MDFEVFENEIIVPVNSSALIIIDMQNDFVHPEGKLFSPNAQNIVQPIKTLLENARQNEVKVIYTQDTHFHNDPVEFPIWGEHVVKGSWGWQIVDELKPLEKDIIIEKLRYDAFFGTSLDHILRIFNIKNLVIVGTVANICVLHTVSSARLHNYEVIVAVDAISALIENDYTFSLRQMDFLYKVKLTKTKYVKFKD